MRPPSRARRSRPRLQRRPRDAEIDLGPRHVRLRCPVIAAVARDVERAARLPDQAEAVVGHRHPDRVARTTRSRPSRACVRSPCGRSASTRFPPAGRRTSKRCRPRAWPTQSAQARPPGVVTATFTESPGEQGVVNGFGPTAGCQVRPASVLRRFSPSSYRAQAVVPSTETQTTGRGERSATFHVFPPSLVREIVPWSLQPNELDSQPSQPVPITPCRASRNAIAFGASATRPGFAASAVPARIAARPRAARTRTTSRTPRTATRG